MNEYKRFLSNWKALGLSFALNNVNLEVLSKQSPDKHALVVSILDALKPLEKDKTFYIERPNV